MQEILVTLIVIAAVVFVVRRLIRQVRAFKGKENPCEHCGGSCHCAKKADQVPKNCEKSVCSQKKQRR